MHFFKKNNMRKCKKNLCTTYASYGKTGGTRKDIEYCLEHAPKGYSNLTVSKCLFPSCSTIPCYGKVGGSKKDALFCKKHSPPGYTDLLSKKCVYTNCLTKPVFGHPKGTRKDAVYCKKHAPKGYVDLINKRCIFPSCTTQPSYGKPGGTRKDAEYCSGHAPEGYVDVSHKHCKESSCTTIPVFGKPGGTGKDAEYCKKHAPEGYVDLVSKKCIYPSCNTLSSYGKPGGTRKDTKYCSKHAPKGYMDLSKKICIFPQCSTSASYGKEGAKKPEFCSKHSPSGYVDVVHPRCAYSGCKTRARYKDTVQSPPKWCSKHKPVDGISSDKKCVQPTCDARPSYNFLGFPASCCSEHKKEGMIRNPARRCKNCGRMATVVDSEQQFFCSNHSSDDCKELGNLCSICYCEFLDGKDTEICLSCQLFLKEKKTVKTKQKELIVKKFLETNNIQIFSYDKTVRSGCSKRRPDFIIQTTWGNIIIEVDENQHRNSLYDCECEIVRMKQIYFDIGIEFLLYIRFNPDSYKSNHENSFTLYKKLVFLLKYIESYSLQKPEKNCSILYLFYDGFSSIDIRIEDIDPYKDTITIYRKGRKYVIENDYKNQVKWVVKYSTKPG